MNIQCPACHASARLSDSKEGAKVRCGACGHVYVARERGARRSQISPTPFIIGGALVLGLIVVLVIAKSDVEPPTARAAALEEPPPPPAPLVEGRGWDSPAVRAARLVHDAAFARDSVGLLRLVDRERVYALRRLGEEAADGSAQAADLAQGRAAWQALSRSEQVEFQTALIDEVIAGADEHAELVAAWKPFDGEWVETREDGVAVVRVKVQPRDAERGVETRNVEWWLAQDDTGRWQAFRWARWIAPEEAKAQRIARSKLTQTVTLSDGSIVIEAEVRPLEHLETTPPELRARIDELYATMIDLSDARAGDRALTQLVEIGKPAIPILLTGFYEIPLESEEQAIQVNLIVRALRDITGQYFGYKPQVAEGSGTGTTDERRQSALKQWFGWWHRKGAKFEEKVLGEDLLDESVIPTPQERRMMERFEKQQQPDNP